MSDLSAFTQPAETPAPVADRTLRDVPMRAAKFLRVVGVDAQVRATLAQRGYTDSEHHLGWALVHKVFGYDAAPIQDGSLAAGALRQIDAVIDPAFRMTRAALDRAYPDQSAFIFQGVDAVRGVQAVPALQRYLDRLDALEEGSDRKKTRKQDHAALEVLASRGITKKERTRLRGLIKDVETPAEPTADPARDKSTADHTKNLVALRAWLTDWTEVARLVIKRKDVLHRMGIGGKRRSKTATTGGSAPTATPPAPAAALPAGNPTPPALPAGPQLARA